MADQENVVPKQGSTGPLKTLNAEETAHLIDLFQGHLALWDVRTPQYRNRTLKATSWTSVRVNFTEACGIECSDENIQAKVTSLRNHFTRELRKQRESRKSGTSTDEVYNSTWPFFEGLMFLMPVVSIIKHTTTNLKLDAGKRDAGNKAVGKTTKNSPSTAGHGPNRSFDLTLSDDELRDSEDELRDEQLDDVNSQVLEELQGVKEVQKDFFPSRKRHQQTDSTVCTEFKTTVMDYMKEKKAGRANKAPEEPDLLWAKNLTHNINGLKNERRRKLLRLDIEDLVNKVLREELAEVD